MKQIETRICLVQCNEWRRRIRSSRRREESPNVGKMTKSKVVIKYERKNRMEEINRPPQN